MLRLGVLDQSPVPSGSTPAEALRETVILAQAAERLGYSRYWLAEHHGTPGLAGTAPEVLAARVAAATSTIRVGAGGILLSHYSPRKVAETFAVLGALFPGRVDLGLGRADGASPATAAALQAGAEGAHRPFGEKLVDLLHRVEGDDPALPAGDGPQPWLLASSSDGAGAAATLGLPLCFAHFISSGYGPQIVARYRTAFRPTVRRQWSEAMVAVAVICAETDEEAERLATSVDVWKLADEDARGCVPSIEEAAARSRTALEHATIVQRRKGLVVGGPDRVADTLNRLACDFDVEELMVLTVCHDPEARLRSYQLLAEAFDLAPPDPARSR